MTGQRDKLRLFFFRTLSFKDERIAASKKPLKVGEEGAPKPDRGCSFLSMRKTCQHKTIPSLDFMRKGNI